jgi:hypothetical protein
MPTNAPPPPEPTQTPPAPTGGAPRTYRVFVSGESIEMRNRFVDAPFTSAGARDDHGADPNRSDEFGWLVPFADRLRLRDGGISIEWVGSDTWKGADDEDYSGTYPTNVAPHTSALSGTSIPSWISWPGGDDLDSQRFCYDVAICARGGNDFDNDDDDAFREQLRQLIVMLSNGSSCSARPLVLVTTHMPDDRQDVVGGSAFVAAQTHRYKTRVEQAVAEVLQANPAMQVRVLDVYSAFRTNATTTAFPASPRWFDGARFDFDRMHRDGTHPRRLASIYAGEVAANAVDLAQLRALP